MRIEFEFDCENDYGDDYNYTPRLMSRRYVAKLIFKIGALTVTYSGESLNKDIDAALGCVQAFLDGQASDRQVRSEIMRDDWRLEFGPMSPEIKNIIENAIDLKTGNCRNKLAESFQ